MLRRRRVIPTAAPTSPSTLQTTSEDASGVTSVTLTSSRSQNAGGSLKLNCKRERRACNRNVEDVFCVNVTLRGLCCNHCRNIGK